MLRLCILRHMDTAWALPGQRDFERELNENGKQDLKAVNMWFRQKKLTPDHVYCSPATRTRQTLAGIQQSFNGTPQISFPDDLYSGFVGEYLKLITSHEKPENLLIIGHNPTCASLANLLASKRDSEALNTVSYTYPTGALAIIDFKITAWNELGEGSGVLVEFLMPRPSSRY